MLKVKALIVFIGQCLRMARRFMRLRVCKGLSYARKQILMGSIEMNVAQFYFGALFLRYHI